MIQKRFLPVLLPVVFFAAGLSSCSAGRSARFQKEMREKLRAEILWTWGKYRRFAWGHDELRPLSKTFRDWYNEPVLMTMVDCLDLFCLMGEREQADSIRTYVVSHLSFDKDISVKHFEITIRLLGGLLSSYQLTGDSALLGLARDLADRMLPVFDSPTGLPYVFVNLKTGKVGNPATNPAEAGTLLLEYGTLSKLTGNPVYYDRAKRALVELYKRRASTGLVGYSIDAKTGEWTNPDASVGCCIDSYYETLFKASLLFGDRECGDMWKEHIRAIHSALADTTAGGLWYGHADMRSGVRTASLFGALDAFFPALLALSGDLDRAARLEDSCLRMWNLHGIEPEALDYRTMTVVNGAYPLRPEIIESAYTLYHFTRDPKYLDMGKTFFDGLVRHCKTDGGYAAVRDVRTMELEDSMESFLFAETFKYLFLLFSEKDPVDWNTTVFNTEAHPLRRTWGDR